MTPVGRAKTFPPSRQCFSELLSKLQLGDPDITSPPGTRSHFISKPRIEPSILDHPHPISGRAVS